MKYLIVQNTIMHYRVPLFQQLGERVNLLVVHSDEGLKSASFPFKVKYVKKVSFGGFTFQPGLHRIMREYDLVLAMFDLKWLSIVSSLLHRDLADKVFLWTHGYGRNNVLDPLRIVLAKRASGIVLYYLENSGKYLNGGVAKSKIFESSNTIFVPNSGLSPHSEKEAFLFVGRLQSRKGIDLLITAFNKLSQEFPYLRLNIVGEGDHRPVLEAQVTSLGIDSKVCFHGRVTEENQLKRLYHDSIAYVSPNHVGLGVLHSFAYGCPVITNLNQYHAPEFLNLVHQENSYLYGEAGTDLYDAMKTFASDPQLSLKYGHNGFKLYQRKRTMETMVNNLYKLTKAIEV